MSIKTVDVELDFNAVAAELAKLEPHEYDRIRKSRADELGVRAKTLDDAVGRLRGSDEEKVGQGQAVELYEPEPWETEVIGVAVLQEALSAVMRHMSMREEDAIACVLWAVHTHIYEIFDHTPRLMITAPDAECGKTVLLYHMVGNLVTKPMPVENMKPAPFFRLAESAHPTYLIDEGDVFLNVDSDLMSGFNNGWEPHGGVLRCVGDDFDVRKFSTHTPVALAGVRIHEKLPPTTVSRCIIVNLERAAEDEIAANDIYDAKVHRRALLDIGRKIARWCNDNRETVRHTDPELPPKVINRPADKWTPLFAIARAAGGNWADHAKKALAAQPDMSEPSKGLQLLTDIIGALMPEETHIATKELIRRLCDMADSPWPDYNFRERDLDRRQIKDRQLAKLLRPYNIHPKAIRVGGVTPRGYDRKAIERAFKRYAPRDTAETSATPQQSHNHAGFSDSVSATRPSNVADRSEAKSLKDKECCTVADNSEVSPAQTPYEEF